MSRKTQRCYAHVFKYIKEHILDMHGQSIMTDFEIPMRNGLSELYPETTLLTCWFHFTQAVKKRAMQTTQFYPYIRTHEDAAAIYYKLMSLPLLPPNLIMEQFQKLKVLARSKHRSIFAEFLEYYEKQWMIKVSNNLFYLNWKQIAQKPFSLTNQFRCACHSVFINIEMVESLLVLLALLTDFRTLDF